MSRFISTSFGVIPSFADFERQIRRISDEENKPYWRKGETFSLELVDDYEVGVMTKCGFEPNAVSQYAHKVRYELTERQIHKLVSCIMKRRWSDEEKAWSLASSIMYVLGYEWI